MEMQNAAEVRRRLLLEISENMGRYHDEQKELLIALHDDRVSVASFECMSSSLMTSLNALKRAKAELASLRGQSSTHIGTSSLQAPREALGRATTI
jgi:hypothetical protein